MSESRWRIGAVSYLNSKPLVHKLASRLGAGQLVFDLPSRLADRLAEGSLDVALVPSIELFLHPDYRIVSDACIACRGPVLSVKLMSRVPFDQVRHLAVDEGSRTSVVLVQALLGEHFSVHPTLESLQISTPWHKTNADAALIIGDRAIRASHPQFQFQMDLGQWWFESTGLPFVFAVWAARPGIETSGLEHLLAEARDEGVRNLEQIARREAPRYRLTDDECRTYFQEYLRYYFGEQEQEALGRFREQAVAILDRPTRTRSTVYN